MTPKKFLIKKSKTENKVYNLIQLNPSSNKKDKRINIGKPDHKELEEWILRGYNVEPVYDGRSLCSKIKHYWATR